MTLPITLAVTTAANQDGTRAVLITYTDATGATLDSAAMVFAPTEAAENVLQFIRARSRSVAAAHLTAADLPASFTVQLGLDTSLRNLDLL